MRPNTNITIMLFLFIFSVLSFSQEYAFQQDWRGMIGPCDNSKIKWGSGPQGQIMCEDGRVFFSVDSGSTWSQKPELNPYKISDIEWQKHDNKNTDIGTAVGDGGLVLNTSNNGLTWVPASSGTTNKLNKLFYAWCPATNESWGYAIGNNSTILITTDAGKTWKKQSTEFQYDHFYGVYFYNNVTGWIVGSTGIIYSTTDSGSHWKYQEGLSSNPDYFDVASSGPDTAAICGESGTIALTTNGGEAWTQSNSGTTENLNSIIYEDKDSVKAVGDNGTYIESNDGGKTWEKIPLGTTSNLNDISIDSKGYLWIAGDNGALFTNRPLISLPAPPGQLKASVKSSSEIELTWVDNAVNELGSIIERQSGSQDTWKDYDTVGTNVVIYNDTGLTPNTEYHYRLSTYNAAGESGYSNEVSTKTLDVVPNVPTNVTVSLTNNLQVLIKWKDNSENESGFSIDKKTGSNQYTKLTDVASNTTYYTDSQVLVGATYTYHLHAFNAVGISTNSNESSLLVTGIEEKSLPDEFALFQNHPNPFNPGTTIRYELPTPEFVTLKVYNSIGKLVASPVNEMKPAGRHQYEFNAANLSSGVYFYQIKAGNFQMIKKMILIK